MKNILNTLKVFVYWTLFTSISACAQTNSKTQKDAQIDILLSLVGKPYEFVMTPMDSIGITTEEGMKFVLSYLSEINELITKNGIDKGYLKKIMSKYSEFLRVKYWDFSINDSSKFLNISDVKKRLGKENSTENGEFKGQKKKFSVLWYKYDWVCFGVDDSSKVRAVRGIYSCPKKPYIRLKNNVLIEVTLEPKLLLFKTYDSCFYMLSSKSIKNIVRVPTNNLQNNTSIPMYEFEHDATKLIITKVSKEVFSRPDLIQFVYKELESQYNSSNSQYGPYWMTGLGAAEKDKLSGVTYEDGVLKRGKFVAFTESMLFIKEKAGNIKSIPVSDFTAFFQ